jgi:hypothetical protein
LSHISTLILPERALDRAYSRWYISCAVGRHIRWARESAGIRRSELAECAVMNTRTLARVEDGAHALTRRELAASARGPGVSAVFPATDTTGTNGNGRRAA